MADDNKIFHNAIFILFYLKKKKKIQIKQASLHPHRVVFQYALHINVYPIEIKSTISYLAMKEKRSKLQKR